MPSVFHCKASTHSKATIPILLTITSLSQQPCHQRFLSIGLKNRLCAAASHLPTRCGKKRARVCPASPSSCVLVSSSATRHVNSSAVSLANLFLLSSGTRVTRNYPSLTIPWVTQMVWLPWRLWTADLRTLESTNVLRPTSMAKMRHPVWWLLRVSLFSNSLHHPLNDSLWWPLYSYHW